MRPRRWDCFPYCGSPTELLLLECRLTELYDVVDGFVIVEAEVDHQDHPKPLNYLANEDRFKEWSDKITYVVAQDLPTMAQDPGEWARETAQREWIGEGLVRVGAQNDDIVFQSDVDEIPTALVARNMLPLGDEAWSCEQRGHFWAVDWLYPNIWNGTVACRAGAVTTFAQMRNTRNYNPPHRAIPNAGWHFSWLGGREAADAKVNSFCHPEVAKDIRGDRDRYWREGIHIDQMKMLPVEVDHTYPKWMQDPANVPESWRRPRD